MTIERVVAVAVLCLSSVGVGLGQTAKESAAVEKQITSTLLPELQVGFEYHVQGAAVSSRVSCDVSMDAAEERLAAAVRTGN